MLSSLWIILLIKPEIVDNAIFFALNLKFFKVRL